MEILLILFLVPDIVTCSGYITLPSPIVLKDGCVHIIAAYYLSYFS